MSGTLPNLASLKVLKGQYRIAKNVHAACRLDIVEADDNGMKLFMGLRKQADTIVPVGTRVFLDSTPLQPASEPPGNGEINCFSVVVKEVSEQEGKPLLVCTPLNRDVLPERRQRARRVVDFPVQLGEVVFRALDGTTKGLALKYEGSKRTLTNLAVERQYPVILNHKGKSYTVEGTLRHIQYDWNTYHHRLGVFFPKLSQEQETILNLLIDPDFRVSIADSQSIDTSKGKISL